jgi:hypothetical protein
MRINRPIQAATRFGNAGVMQYPSFQDETTQMMSLINQTFSTKKNIKDSPMNWAKDRLGDWWNKGATQGDICTDIMMTFFITNNNLMGLYRFVQEQSSEIKGQLAQLTRALQLRTSD